MLREHQLTMSLRSAARAAARGSWRSGATARFEAGRGEQLQTDCGEQTAEVTGEKERVCCLVATLGYSCGMHTHVFLLAR